MQFLMLVCRDSEPVTDPDEPKLDIDQWVETMEASGKRLLGDRLAPQNTAKVVRVRAGRTVVTDGPFVETKEILGGFDVLEARDVDEAVEIAAAHPFATQGVIELRPVWTE